MVKAMKGMEKRVKVDEIEKQIILTKIDSNYNSKLYKWAKMSTSKIDIQLFIIKRGYKRLI
jgi:hypothetical protein